MNEKEFFVRENLNRIQENAGTVAGLSFNDALGDTVMEKFELFYIKLVELFKLVEAKGVRGQKWVVVSPEFTDFISRHASFSNQLELSKCSDEVSKYARFFNWLDVWVDALRPVDSVLVGIGYEKNYGQSTARLAIHHFKKQHRNVYTGFEMNMTDVIKVNKDIGLLRYALASVWTECEKDLPNLEDIQQIVGEALTMTEKYERKGKDLTNGGTGLEGWIQYNSPKNPFIES